MLKTCHRLALCASRATRRLQHLAVNRKASVPGLAEGCSHRGARAHMVPSRSMAAQGRSKLTEEEFAAAADVTTKQEDQDEIVALYTKLASDPTHDFGWQTGPENARSLGYQDAWIDGFPPEVFESNAAGGCPFLLGDIHQGATVVDFGCGAGADVCVAAELVGPSGLVIGVDMTPAMLDKAWGNVQRCGFEGRVELILGSPEWPQLSGGSRGGKNWATRISPASVDFVISNNVINLIEAKLWCYVEACVLLKPGGRLQMVDCVRDLDAERANPQYVASVDGTLADWVTGTVPPQVQMDSIAKAGFVDVVSHGVTGYRTSPVTVSELFSATKPGDAAE